MERIPRVTNRKQMLSGALGALVVAVFVATRLPKQIFAFFYEDGITVENLLPLAFFTVYFGILAWMVFRGLAAFQTLEIEREEIRVFLGPVLLRRIPTNAIRSAIPDYKEQGRSSRPVMYVIKLLFESPAQRREQGEKPMLSASFWMEDTPELRAALSRTLPRKVWNPQERL